MRVQKEGDLEQYISKMDFERILAEISKKNKAQKPTKKRVNIFIDIDIIAAFEKLVGRGKVSHYFERLALGLLEAKDKLKSKR